MGSVEERRIENIYNERKTFADFVMQDRGVWLNVMEFARPHNINGHEIISVLTSEKTTQNIYTVDGEKITGAGMILFANREDIAGVMAGQSVKIDGKIYLIEDAQDLHGALWKIKLTGDVS